MSTFFMFWLYAAPAARMAALQKLRFIGIATHDSITLGEDGPTHQPVALPAFYRGLPQINLIRPADVEEVIGAYQLALGEGESDHPSILALSRHAVPHLSGTNRDGVAKGAYVVVGDDSTPDVTILATGAEVFPATEAAKLIEKTNNVKVRVVSMPSFKHFDAQSAEYRRKIIPSSKSLVVAVEAWGAFGWPRYAHAGCHMHTFGHSAPQKTLYEHFGFTPEILAKKIGDWVETRRGGEGSWDIPGVGEFAELLNGIANH
jgi:dihydroxyacetone synthase